MEYDMLLLRFGEITLKGRNRSRFEKVIHNHVKALMHDFPGRKSSKNTEESLLP